MGREATATTLLSRPSSAFSTIDAMAMNSEAIEFASAQAISELSEKLSTFMESDLLVDEQLHVEPRMCFEAIVALVAGMEDPTGMRILDFGAGRGQMGQLLAQHGFTEVYGQEGSLAKKQSLERQGLYKDIETFIVGKQSLPKAYRRSFDVVTCSGGLGTNLLPAQCFSDMLNALKPDGFVVFTVSQKHMSEADSFGMGYFQAVEKLEQRGAWHNVDSREFVKDHGGVTSELFSLFVFQKK